MMLMVVGITIGLLSGVFITALFANPANMYDKGFEEALDLMKQGRS